MNPLNAPKMQDRFRLLVEELEDCAIFMLDAEGYVTSWSEGAKKLTGYTEDEIIGSHFSVFYTDEAVEDGASEKALDHVSRSGQWVDEGWRRRKDGGHFWALITISALRDDEGRLRGFGIVTRDLTERRQQEKVLERQKEQAERENELLRLRETVAAMGNESNCLRSVLPGAMENVCNHTDWAVGHVYWSSPGERGQLVSSGIWHLPAPDQFATLRAVTEAANVDEGESLPGTVTASGEPVWIPDVTEESAFLRGQGGEDLGVKGACAVPVQTGEQTVAVLEFFSTATEEPDERLRNAIEFVGGQLSRVAERERDREALQDSEERYRSLMKSAADAVVILDDKERIIDWNPGASVMFGYHREEILGHSMDVLMSQRFNVPHRRNLGTVCPSDEHRLIGSTVELDGVRKGGDEFPLELSFSSWVSNGERYFAAIIRDVTERQQLEEELLRIQDEERQRLGQELHDGVCSLLTATGIVTSSLAERVEKGRSVKREELDKATEYVQKAADEVRAVSHGLSPVGLERGLLSALDALTSRVEGRGELCCSFHADNDVPDLSEEPATHLYRIAQEAVSNALKHAEADRVEVRLMWNDEGAVVLTVQDDGQGIAEEAVSEDGLGMRTMRRRANLIGGALTIENASNGGTVVQCRLPFSVSAEK